LIGDIVGRPGRRILREKLPGLLRTHRPDLVVANGENAAGGRGITAEVAGEIWDSGVDVITLGNHTWDNRQVVPFIDQTERLIRPANYPPGVPGRGYVLYELSPAKKPVAIINLIGRTFMPPQDCPFQTADRLLAEIGAATPLVVVDFHGEATSEKLALGYYLAGRVTAVVGTHTHTQTADERILAGGTAYITDLGMAGPRESVLGVRPDIIIHKFLTQMPVRHELAEGPLILTGVLVEANDLTGRAESIARIREDLGEE
jgi:metallophosphoesterase (TIGR00282 family)